MVALFAVPDPRAGLLLEEDGVEGGGRVIWIRRGFGAAIQCRGSQRHPGGGDGDGDGWGGNGTQHRAVGAADPALAPQVDRGQAPGRRGVITRILRRRCCFSPSMIHPSFVPWCLVRGTVGGGVLAPIRWMQRRDVEVVLAAAGAGSALSRSASRPARPIQWPPFLYLLAASTVPVFGELLMPSGWLAPGPAFC